MSNFPVNPDLATSSILVYDESAVVAQFGKNLTIEQLQPRQKFNQYGSRVFSYVQDPLTSYPINDWNDEATNGYQGAEFAQAFSLFENFYSLQLVPNDVAMCIITRIEFEDIIRAGTSVHCMIQFYYIPFEPIP
jgi:hypothetical protein